MGPRGASASCNHEDGGDPQRLAEKWTTSRWPGPHACQCPHFLSQWTQGLCLGHWLRPLGRFPCPSPGCPLGTGRHLFPLALCHPLTQEPPLQARSWAECPVGVSPGSYSLLKFYALILCLSCFPGPASPWRRGLICNLISNSGLSGSPAYRGCGC